MYSSVSTTGGVGVSLRLTGDTSGGRSTVVRSPSTSAVTLSPVTGARRGRGVSGGAGGGAGPEPARRVSGGSQIVTVPVSTGLYPVPCTERWTSFSSGVSLRSRGVSVMTGCVRGEVGAHEPVNGSVEGTGPFYLSRR